MPCGTKFLREFIFADWRFFVFYGKNVSGNFQYLRELIFVTWVPEDIFFVSIQVYFILGILRADLWSQGIIFADR